MNTIVESQDQRWVGDRPAARLAGRAVVDEAEDYVSSVAGVDVEVVQIGAGSGTEVTAARWPRFTFTSSKIGFPMLSRTMIRDDMVAITYMRRTIAGSRWCEMSLQPGAVVVHAPSSPHTARNLVGTEFMFVIAKRAQLDEHADLLGIRLQPPPRGEVHLLAPSTKTGLIGPTFETLARHSAAGGLPSAAVDDGVVSAISLALSEDDRKQRIGGRNRIDGRQVVWTCMDYAESIQRIPSISELCLVANVSERTLRAVFVREYDLPPTQYFRAWALDQAHRRFIDCVEDSETVTEVATGLGFDHLGRFSIRYKQIYGEPPSETLRTAR
jgi:AraC-like DNA-binding protein